MIIYVDLLITSNLFINYLFIKFIHILFKEKGSIIRIIISLIISLLSLLLFFAPSKYIYNLRYFVGIIIGLIAFLKKDFKTSIIQIVIYYLLNISFIGTLVIFNINNMFLLFISAFFVITLWIIESYKITFIKQNSQHKKIRINKLKLNGYLDSGCNTYCDSIPVVFVNEKYLNFDFTFFKKMEVLTINGYNSIDIYKGPLLYVDKKEYVVYYSFVKSLNKDIIISNDLGD
jgi:hypothetical protein